MIWAEVYFISGGKEENLDFEMGPGASADGSCAAELNGEMFVFGGNENNKQVLYSYSKLFQWKILTPVIIWN